MKDITVIKILPNKEDKRSFDVIVDASFKPTWDNLRETIGGYVRSAHVGMSNGKPVYAFFDEDAIPKRRPVSCSVGGYDFRGPVVILGGDGGDKLESVDDATIASLAVEYVK